MNKGVILRDLYFLGMNCVEDPSTLREEGEKREKVRRQTDRQVGRQAERG
jgi:hypothetical protein